MLSETWQCLSFKSGKNASRYLVLRSVHQEGQSQSDVKGLELEYLS